MMKKTIQQQLVARKYAPPSRLVAWLYKKIMVDMVAKKYCMHVNRIADVNDCDGPCFVIFNHLSRIDHAYVLAATYPRRINMVASYSEFNRKKFAFIFRLNQIIPKKNYYADTTTIRAISKIIQQGGCVAFAPEGLASNDGSNKPIVPGTSKLFKHYRVPVYLCFLEGQYLQNTKVCLDERYGETFATMSLLFSREDVEKLSVAEMDAMINEKFRHNEYAWNREKGIKWETNGRICHRLEDLCYQCPRCHAEFTMHGHGNQIKCTACGNAATMDDFYQFHPDDGAVIPESPHAWFDWEREQIIKAIRANPDYRFEDRVRIGNLDPYHLVKDAAATSFPVGIGQLWIDHQGLHYRGSRRGQDYHFDLDYHQVYTAITSTDMSNFNLYIDGEYFDFYPEHQTVGKFLLLIEEMHRLHVNFYKNFPWNDYMYKN